MMNNVLEIKLYQLVILFQLSILFFSGPSFAISDEKYEKIKRAHKEMHKWAPVAGRLYMNSIDRVTNTHELVVEFIWDSKEGFGTSEELKKGGEKSHAFEMSITFNDKEKEGKVVKYSDLLECIYTDRLKYNSIAFDNGDLEDYEMLVNDCNEKSLVSDLKLSEAEFYVDTRAGDEESAQDFAFGLNEASKVNVKGADGNPMIYKVKFKVRQQNFRITDAPVILKVNKLFDIALDLEDGEDDIDISDDLDTWRRPRCVFRDFCYANASIEKNGKCAYIGSNCLTMFEDDFKCYTLGRKKSCNYETDLNHGFNVLLDTQYDAICGDNCNDISVRRNSPYLTWCLASKDDAYDTEEEALKITIPEQASVPVEFPVELLQCLDEDWFAIKPTKSALYNITLPVPQGTDFDFTLYSDPIRYASRITTKDDLKNRRKLEEKVSAVFLEGGREYLIKLSSKAKFAENYVGGWFTNLKISYFEPFPDVSGDEWYANAIAVLYLTDVIGGNENSAKFHPDDPISRAEFMKMLINTIALSFGKNVFEGKCHCPSSSYERAAPCASVTDWKERVASCALGYPTLDNPIYFWQEHTQKDLKSALSKEEAAQALAIALDLNDKEKCSFEDCEDYIKIVRKLNGNVFRRVDGVVYPTEKFTRGEAASVLVKTFFTEDYIRNIKNLRKK